VAPGNRRHAGVAFDHRLLHFDRERTVSATLRNSTMLPSPALDDAAILRGNGGSDEIAPQSPKP
jgi:hypothetical protein